MYNKNQYLMTFINIDINISIFVHLSALILSLCIYND